MNIGLIGAGNMASALARGWNEPALIADIAADKAGALAEAMGGSVAASNEAVAEGSDIVVLCHKPAQLQDVAESTAGKARAIVSILGGVPVGDVEAAYPASRCTASCPTWRPRCTAESSVTSRGNLGLGPTEVLELFGRLGTVVPMPDDQMDNATAIMSCAPAWLALVAEALVDAAVKRGIDRGQAESLVAETVAGTGALLADAGHTPAEVRRRVTSPGGPPRRGWRCSRTGACPQRSTRRWAWWWTGELAAAGDYARDSATTSRR